MPASLAIPVAPGPIEGSIRPPGSKSITNRALVCAALARGSSRLTGVLDSEDTRVMVAGLAALGAGVAADWSAEAALTPGEDRADIFGLGPAGVAAVRAEGLLHFRRHRNREPDSITHRKP